MKIEHAFTWKYEMNHFGEMLEHPPTKEGSCFENVINFCELYKSKGRNTSVSLVIGLRAWEDSCTAGYHYLVKDDDTGEFSDPQYSRYTFIEIHNWSLEDYKKDCNEFFKEHDFEQSSEFYQWYVNNGFGKSFEKGLGFIKSLATWRIKLTDADIKERCTARFIDAEPKYGKQVVSKLEVD